MSTVWHFATLALVTTWWLDLVWAPPQPTRATESIQQKVMNFWTQFENDLFVMFQRLSVCNSCVPSLKQLGVEKDNTSKNSLENISSHIPHPKCVNTDAIDYMWICSSDLNGISSWRTYLCFGSDIYNIVHSPFERIYGSARLIHSKVKVFRNLKSRTGLKTNTWNKHSIWKLILQIHKEFTECAEGRCHAFEEGGGFSYCKATPPSSNFTFKIFWRFCISGYHALSSSGILWIDKCKYIFLCDNDLDTQAS